MKKTKCLLSVVIVLALILVISNWTHVDSFGERIFSYKVIRGSFTNGSEHMSLITSSIPNVSKMCPSDPPGLVGRFNTSMTPLPFEEIRKLHPSLRQGGTFSPKWCQARYRVAIIIPCRDREMHLKVLLNNLHLVLQRQLLDYTVYVVEQAPAGRYNKALSMNAGVKEALKERDYQCFVFHDVDTIPENDKNMYSCPETPRHLATAIERYNYKLKYKGAFGGATAFKKEHLLLINGFSNMFYGWGQEDDDILRRIRHKGLKMVRVPYEIGRYRTITHKRDKLNKPNLKNVGLLRNTTKRMEKDGLNSVQYKVLKLEKRPLYTWIFISCPPGK